MAAKKRSLIQNDRGQAIIEFAIFLPLMLILYSTVMSIGNAINGSINQQKATRSYFYFRVQNNSTVPKPIRGGAPGPYIGWNTFSMYMFGWRDKVTSGATPVPMTACYRLRLPLQEDESDVCEEPYTDTTTQFIRVATAYGICGATYIVANSSIVPLIQESSNGPLHCEIN
jgi:hypothetical protein